MTEGENEDDELVPQQHEDHGADGGDRSVQTDLHPGPTRGRASATRFQRDHPMPRILVDDPNPDIRSPGGQQAAEAWFARREHREVRYLEATGYRNPMDWASEHWGITKTKAYDFRVIADESDRYEFEFDTGSSPRFLSGR